MRKNRLFIMLAIPVMIAVMLCSCASRASDIDLPDEQKVRQKISSIIEDKFDDPVKLSENEKEIVWEVNLPDRNDLKVKFRFYKANAAVSIDGSGIGSYWELRSQTDYVMQIISAFDNSLKSETDKEYGITAGSTEVSEKYDMPCVTVHTDMSLEELTDDKAIAYINECMKLYDFKAVQVSSPGIATNQGVEKMMFAFVMDKVPNPDGTPLTYEITLISSSLSAVKLTGEGEYFDERWLRQQMDMDRDGYLNTISEG